VLLSPSDNAKILNFTNFNDLGINTLEGSKAFKKIQKFSKSNNQDLFKDISDFNTRYTRLSDLYYTNKNLIDSSTYNIIRQHNFTSNLSTKNQPTSFLDTKSLTTFNEYNHNLVSPTNTTTLPEVTKAVLGNNLNLYTNTSHNYLTDNKKLNNPVHYNLATNSTNGLLDDLQLESEFSHDSTIVPFTSNLLQNSVAYTFQDLKSVNQSISAGDRTVRLTSDTGFSKLNTNTNEKQEKIQNTVFSNQGSTLGNKILDVNAGASRK
jgi:hypothetical protein